jgi:hypothetical protein
MKCLTMQRLSRMGLIQFRKEELRSSPVTVILVNGQIRDGQNTVGPTKHGKTRNSISIIMKSNFGKEFMRICWGLK